LLFIGKISFYHLIIIEDILSAASRFAWLQGNLPQAQRDPWSIGIRLCKR